MLASLVLAWMFSIAQAAEQSPTAKPLGQGAFQVAVSQGNLSLDANQAPLAKVLEEIGKQSGIAVDSNIGPEEKITIRLENVSIEDGFKRLTRNVTIIYTQGLKEKKGRITRVVVLSEKKAGASKFEGGGLQREGAAVKEAAPPPEPFKFGFDPAKSMVKEKER
jgi:hypothetical protein